MSKSTAKVLKGQEAEDKILEYVKKMNRPYGAVDVAANLKGAVAKATTQKILVALADRGELTQKTYAKTTFFVANQAKVATLPAETMTQLETEYKSIDEENKLLTTEIKSTNSELARLKATPSDAELDTQTAQVARSIAKITTLLQPLRSGAPLVSAEELAQVNANFVQWRTEWVKRKKIYLSLWGMMTDSMTPQDSAALVEELGIELDTEEHLSVESGPLCTRNAMDTNPLKRKR
ncbi:TBPIP-domain-containing protein [Mycena floridula]|nr:TBPIP-domain-containing protein [Mycena floridula]